MANQREAIGHSAGRVSCMASSNVLEAELVSIGIFWMFRASFISLVKIGASKTCSIVNDCLTFQTLRRTLFFFFLEEQTVGQKNKMNQALHMLYILFYFSTFVWLP
jgi:hypothetical protein